MKRFKLTTLGVFVVAAGLGALLLNVSQDVQHAEEELALLRHQIQQEREQIRVLRAEWEYLNNPERLELLATQYLGFQSPEIETFMVDPSLLPERDAMQEGASSGALVHEIVASPPQASDTPVSQDHLPPLAGRKSESEKRDFGRLLKRLEEESQ